MILAAVLIASAVPGMGDLGVPVSEIPRYQRALAEMSDGPSLKISFRDLWDRPERYRGQVVEVRGTIAREFVGEASGELPSRIETWIASPAGDLTCLVYPAGERVLTSDRISTPIRFVGTFLGVISYESGDAVRLAPLVVGPAGPYRQPESLPASSGDDATGWVVGLVLLGLFALVLGRVSLRRPARRVTDRSPPVEFES